MSAKFLDGDCLRSKDEYSLDHIQPAKTVTGNAETRKLRTEASGIAAAAVAVYESSNVC